MNPEEEHTKGVTIAALAQFQLLVESHGEQDAKKGGTPKHNRHQKQRQRRFLQAIDVSRQGREIHCSTHEKANARASNHHNHRNEITRCEKKKSNQIKNRADINFHQPFNGQDLQSNKLLRKNNSHKK